MRVVIGLLMLLSACSGAGADRRTLVASVYPLAWAAKQIVGPEWDVIDLTPPGAEAHDIELTLEQRSQIEEADVVLYLGDVGFQPQVEAALEDTAAAVVDTSSIAAVYTGTPGDPHFWMAPSSMRPVVLTLTPVRDRVDPDTEWLAAAEDLWTSASRLHTRYNRDLKRAACRYDTLVVGHEAFAALQLYDVAQFGLSGLSPEAEPSAERLAEARDLIDSDQAGAVFYDQSDEDRRVAETFADDAGVPALPLNTLESRPIEGDYLSAMEDNLDSLREGLACE
jgi:zinc transport system substrate-binding protein